MRNVYMTDELEAIYEQTVDFVRKEVTPHGDAWEEAGQVPREVLRKMAHSACSASGCPRRWVASASG